MRHPCQNNIAIVVVHLINKSVGKVAGDGHVSRTSHSLTHCRVLFVLAFVSARTLRGSHAGIK